MTMNPNSEEATYGVMMWCDACAMLPEQLCSSQGAWVVSKAWCPGVVCAHLILGGACMVYAWSWSASAGTDGHL